MTVKVVLGLGFGDEGKGTIVDWLARQAATPPLVVRYGGGPQAMHHVVTDDGRTHCFAQLGAGGFVPGARTHLGPDMAVDPYALVAEAAALAEVGVPAALTSLSIDPRCVLVTPWHALVNRVRELVRGDARHGSTGRGVAEAKLGAIAVRAGQLGAGLADALAPLRRALAAEAAALIAAHPAAPEAARALAARFGDDDLAAAVVDAAAAIAAAGVAITPTLPAADDVILEGAHGALLDQDHGFVPHVTPSRITRAAAEAAARALGLAGSLEVWGVVRAYHTRHGAGPFPSELPGLAARLPERHNPDDGWSGAFRVGWFDAVLARYALGFAGPIDRLAVTCVDRLTALAEVAIVDAWRTPRGDVTDLAAIAAGERTALAAAATPIARRVPSIIAAIEAALGRTVDVTSWGPTARGKRAPPPTGAPR
ncbi:MAG: adenylosuccinate synthetase [Myxococcales bacterium]|nr:adenylosuccinate synthetase [Myxococcales bacterium]